MDAGNKLSLIGIMLLLMGTGIMAMFNLGASISPALNTAITGSAVNIFWSIVLRFIVSPILIVGGAWMIWKIITEA